MNTKIFSSKREAFGLPVKILLLNALYTLNSLLTTAGSIAAGNAF